jgi:methylamine dehydrogenase accessory protein MauD
MDALIASNAILWVLVIALAAIVLALARQVGLLHERLAPAGALVTADGPAVGERAAVLEVEDWNGAPRRVGGLAADGRGTLLFFVSPTCPVCKTLLPLLDPVLAAEESAWNLVVASDGPRSEHEAFVRDHHLARRPYVLSAELGLLYRVGRLPYAVLIDAQGAVRAKGLVNTREHLESLFEAHRRGVATVQEYLRRGAREVA